MSKKTFTFDIDQLFNMVEFVQCTALLGMFKTLAESKRLSKSELETLGAMYEQEFNEFVVNPVVKEALAMVANITLSNDRDQPEQEEKGYLN